MVATPIVPLPPTPARPDSGQSPPEGHLTDTKNHPLNLTINWILLLIFILENSILAQKLVFSVSLDVCNPSGYTLRS